MSDDALDLARAAERLGVHYQTAYRWVREGTLPATRVRGRYRIAVEDLDALAAARDAPRPPAPTNGRRDWPRLLERVHGALRRGDEREVGEVVTRLHAQQEPVRDLVARLLAPAMARIGDEWEAGSLSVAEEHRASEIVERVLAGLDQRRPGRPRGTAVAAAPPGEHHGLPVRMAAAALREDGWTVELLGRDLPLPDLVSFVERTAADLVVLSVATVEALAGAHHARAVLDERGHAVVVGAPGAPLTDLLATARAVRSRQRRAVGPAQA